jgi:hypothetical protein
MMREEKPSQKCTKPLVRTCSYSVRVFVTFYWWKYYECFNYHKKGLWELKSPTSIKEMRINDSLIEVPYMGQKEKCLYSLCATV